jgi:cytochrome P450
VVGDSTFDLFLPLRSSGALENPFAIYSLLRTVRPVMRMPIEGWDGPGVWFLTRHDDVSAVLRDARYSVERLRAPLIRDNLDRLPAFIRQTAQGLRSMLTMDPPDHTRVRKLVNKAFTPRRIAELRGHVERIVDHLLEPVMRRGRMDVIDALAAPLPAIVAGVGQANATDARESSAPALQRLFAYLAEIIAARRREPRDDLISAMVLAQEERDALTDSELLATSNLILIAGHETTTNLIGNTLDALLRFPDQLARLKEDPPLIRTCVEEGLRFESSNQLGNRRVLQDIEIGGEHLAAGTYIHIGIGAANRDPAEFPDPDRFDAGRTPNRHLAFGSGVHMCLGATLARMEGTIALDRFIRRFPHYRRDGDSVRGGRARFRGFAKYPVAW